MCLMVSAMEIIKQVLCVCVCVCVCVGGGGIGIGGGGSSFIWGGHGRS